jgi:hypothetical protein
MARITLKFEFTKDGRVIYSPACETSHNLAKLIGCPHSIPPHHIPTIRKLGYTLDILSPICSAGEHGQPVVWYRENPNRRIN